MGINSGSHAEAYRWLGVGFLALSLTLSLTLFLPVQIIASTLSSIKMGQVGFAYLTLLVLGGFLLVGLLTLSSIVLRIIGWINLCKARRQYCLQFFVVTFIEPFVLASVLLHLFTFNSNLSLAISSLWLSVLIELTGVIALAYSTSADSRIRKIILLAAYLGYLFSTIMVVLSSTPRNVLSISLSHLAASSIASIILAIIGVTLILSPTRVSPTINIWGQEK